MVRSQAADSLYGSFLFRQKTAYEVRSSDGSSDVCSSDLAGAFDVGDHAAAELGVDHVLAKRDARRLVDLGMAKVAARRTGVHRPRHLHLRPERKSVV